MTLYETKSQLARALGYATLNQCGARISNMINADPPKIKVHNARKFARLDNDKTVDLGDAVFYEIVNH